MHVAEEDKLYKKTEKCRRSADQGLSDAAYTVIDTEQVCFHLFFKSGNQNTSYQCEIDCNLILAIAVQIREHRTIMRKAF